MTRFEGSKPPMTKAAGRTTDTLEALRKLAAADSLR